MIIRVDLPRPAPSGFIAIAHRGEMANRTVGIRDVARRARVGVSTVSRVLNNHPDVSPETRDKVMKVVQRLKFRPHGGARQLVRDSIETICFVMSNREVINLFHSHILIGVEDYARKRHHNVIFLRLDYSPDTPSEEFVLPRVIWERGTVAGLVIAGTNYSNLIETVSSLDIPYVVFSNNLVGDVDTAGIDLVGFDNADGTRQATEYLIELGHRDICFVADVRLPWYRRCHDGYAAAMKKGSLTPKRLDLQQRGSAFDYGAESAGQILRQKRRPSAIVAGDDHIALGMMNELQRQGIQIPEDISLVGSDDIDELKYFRPALTTLQVPKETIGGALAEALFERLENPGAPPVQRLIPTRLVVRQSCAPVKTAAFTQA